MRLQNINFEKVFLSWIGQLGNKPLPWDACDQFFIYVILELNPDCVNRGWRKECPAADSVLGNREAFACFECTYPNLMYNSN